MGGRIGRFVRRRDGASAVEFAIIAPLFLLVLLTMCAYGIYLGAAHAVQQIAADSARTALAGLTASERETLAQDYIRTVTLDYPLIAAEALAVKVGEESGGRQFTVRLTYDARSLPIWGLFAFPLPSSTIERFSTIRLGGLEP
ncbi:TadE/TadG family type IV pilus assembly protein [Pararhizobium haloflavum]|uniref:TadE/TadG family type IV pilus assembly protein n=1 Tax=Pararhizobium haloflavum TaxID=2037914 RepID=UPI000C1770D7|nr:TadE/TadG family type IV pilus assembly protein [Pararhizobium haloflavum]